MIEECCQLRLLGRKFVSMIGVVPTSVGAAVKAAGRLTGWRQLVFSLWLGGVLCERPVRWRAHSALPDPTLRMRCVLCNSVV